MRPGRRPLIAGNWKMHTSYEEALALARGCVERIPASLAVDVAIHPPFIWLVPVSKVLEGSAIALGAQNCAAREDGPLTGEVSAHMLAPFCRYVIVGHSERRLLLHEDDAAIAAKLRLVFDHGMTPILCVGEQLAQREAGQAGEVVTQQLRAALDGLTPDRLARLVIAYEPVWAIGTGVPATPADAEAMAQLIRAVVAELGTDGAALRVLYGGSVNATNAAGFLAMPAIDGALVGGASLDVEQFSAIVQAAEALYQQAADQATMEA
ncbi:triose-phosphate isomerase [Thermorudis peleae]|uniref:triose-phosphate isomerase n=1 Tax=Thermorudis peleae TaxID=1382356 RepID=UPI00056E27DD|nr:triose-phosphate isomerase [Thermorudis peleae]MBX6754128.1 triose-phosphate isomerase [Thermorudis peleae]